MFRIAGWLTLLLEAESYLCRMAAGGFSGGHGIAGDAVAGVGEEIAADAATGEQQAIDITSDQGAERNLVGLGLDATGVQAFVLLRINRVDIDAEGDIRRRILVLGAIAKIICGHRVTTMDAATLAHTDLGASRNKPQIRPATAE
jgi:hypothetical protein